MNSVEETNASQNESVQPEQGAPESAVGADLSQGFSARDDMRETPELNSDVSFVPQDQMNSNAYPNGDDPDRVPVAPELADDEVPNMPGAILKHAREMLGMSQREVATKLMVRVNTVSDIEHDRLNQPTAVQFASQHIESYCRLVNIDPQAVLDVYRQNVREVQVQALRHEAEERSSERKSAGILKPVLMGVGALVLVGAGVMIGMGLSSSSSDEQSSGALVLDPTAQVQQQMSEDQGLLDGPLPPPPAEELPPPPPLDPNTEMARQQALELGTNEIISNAQKPADNSVRSSDDQPTLSVAPAAAPIVPAAKPVQAPAAAPAPAPAPKAETQSQDEVKTARTQTAVPKQVKNEPKPEQKTVQAVPVKTAEAEAPAPKLGAVRDITSSARLTNRNDIGSLNSVSVKVNGPVSLKITGNGKILKSGSFKKGDTVSATGMPPLRVEVTDSALIRVSYNGGTVTVPAGKNVGYDLPTR